MSVKVLSTQVMVILVILIILVNRIILVILVILVVDSPEYTFKKGYTDINQFHLFLPKNIFSS